MDINIYLKTIDGETTDIQCNVNDTVSRVIELYKTKANITDKMQVLLIHKGKNLKPEKKLSDYEVEDDEVLHVMFRLPGGI